MRIAIGTDHAGFDLKQDLIDRLEKAGHEVTDVGAFDAEPSDYPDSAAAVARSVVSGESERGIVVCGSGAGAAIAAGKINGIKAATIHDHYSAHQAVEHDGLNVLALGARVVGSESAWDIVQAYLSATFTGEERHLRRLAKVDELDRNRV
ncbi:MAG: ribose 5-phosphate isomerase B [Acidimicrobiia bacterium]|nr:MAG: ribose 5-phosphate isomerase B [Acidimicrobiia bacterium]